MPIASGVPQGSVLGPVLFGLYSSDLRTVLAHCKCRRYANDTQMYLHTVPTKLDNALTLVERDAQAVSDWAETNGLELNAKKTQVIILGSSPYVSAINLANLRKITINHTPLGYATEVKNLGVIMNQTVDWNLHVAKVQSKVYSSLAALRFHRRSMSFALKTQLIKSLVIPHFDYASVTYMHVDKTRGKELQIAHNAYIRFIHGYVPFIPTNNINTHLTHLRLKLGWLSLASRRHLQLLTLFYKVICNADLVYLRHLLKVPTDDAVVSQSSRLPPRAFDYKTPRTEAWNSSFTVEGQR